jgi:hypothetical protein
MICDPYSATIASDPYGLGNIELDNNGSLVALARGAVLHTWYYEEPWRIGTDKLLERIDRRYDPMQSEDPLTGERKAETPVTMKRDLPLVAQPGSSEVAAIARLGQGASLVQTDNQSWVQLRTESGVLGWFQLQDYFMVLIDGQAFFGDDVFGGLNMAD